MYYSFPVPNKVFSHQYAWCQRLFLQSIRVPLLLQEWIEVCCYLQLPVGSDRALSSSNVLGVSSLLSLLILLIKNLNQTSCNLGSLGSDTTFVQRLEGLPCMQANIHSEHLLEWPSRASMFAVSTLGISGIPLFFVLKSCSACSNVFADDIYGDHVVSCAEVDIGLGGGRDKSLRPADMLLYSWGNGLDVCVDLTGSSPLTQTVMVDFMPGRAVIEAAQRKRVKYEAKGHDICVDLTWSSPLTQTGMVDFVVGHAVIKDAQRKHAKYETKCADIGYGFLPFLFYSFGKLEKDVITFLKRIRKFSVSLLVLPLCVLKTFHPRSNLECKSAIKRQRQEESIVNAIRYWSLLAVRVLSSSGVSPYNDATLGDLKTKHPFKPHPLLPHISIDHHHLIASPAVVLDRIKSFPRGTSCGRDGLRAQHLMDCLSGAAVAIFDERLVSKVSAIMIGHSLDGYLNGLQFGVGVAGESEAILHSVNRLIEALGDDVGLSMLLMDFKNAFNLVDREVVLREVRLRCPAISHWIRDSFGLSLHAWYLDDGTIIGDTMVVGKVLELIMKDGPGCGLHLNVDKTEIFWPKEDPRSRSAVAKTIGLMDAIAKINDPQCELLLLRSCTGISRLYFTMRICPPRVFESAQRSFDVALRSSLERIVTASGPGFGEWQRRLATLPFAFEGLGFYSAGDVLNYAFLASRLQSASLQTMLLRHTGIVSPGPIFDDALSVFNTYMETGLMSNTSEIAAPKLIKKMADIYFTRVTKNAESIFSLSPRQMALWTSQMEDHTSDWLRTVPISGLGQTMNALFRLFKGFCWDIYGDHAVSCAGIIGIKHRHNVVRDTLVDICYRSGISTGKEVDIGLDEGRDKPLRPADMLLYSWDGGLDVCVDLTGSSPLTQTGMVDFVPGRAVIDAAQRKHDAVTLLKRIRKFFMTQDIEARAAVHIFNRISFAIAKGVGTQIVSRLPFNLFFDEIKEKEGKVRIFVSCCRNSFADFCFLHHYFMHGVILFSIFLFEEPEYVASGL
ncbi:hypothetical protein Tco_1247723 [Tanacetum coccineum]